MALHLKTGEEGENLAREWLRERGYEILHRNWRHRHYEIDIIAMKDKKLHFVEVKCRKSDRFGNPEESVTKRKFKNLQRAADEFLFLYPGHKWIQYDILSIIMHRNKEADYFLLEDVFL